MQDLLGRGRGTVTAPITDVIAITEKTPDVPPGYVKIPVDLNKGSGGRYIYLCYTRGAGPAVTDLEVVFGKNAQAAAGYQFVMNPHNNARQDLNEGAGGEYIFLTYSRNPGLPVIDIVIQAWPYGVPNPPAPCVPSTDPKNQYQRIEGELNKGAGGWYIVANQLVRNADPDPPDFPIQLATDPKPMVAAYLNGTEWEIGRAQVDYERVAIWKVKVVGQTDGASAEYAYHHTFKTYDGIQEADATEVQRQWNLSAKVPLFNTELTASFG
jgi:hypothetical protein